MLQALFRIEEEVHLRIQALLLFLEKHVLDQMLPGFGLCEQNSLNSDAFALVNGRVPPHLFLRRLGNSPNGFDVRVRKIGVIKLYGLVFVYLVHMRGHVEVLDGRDLLGLLRLLISGDNIEIAGLPVKIHAINGIKIAVMREQVHHIELRLHRVQLVLLGHVQVHEAGLPENLAFVIALHLGTDHDNLENNLVFALQLTDFAEFVGSASASSSIEVAHLGLQHIHFNRITLIIIHSSLTRFLLNKYYIFAI